MFAVEGKVVTEQQVIANGVVAIEGETISWVGPAAEFTGKITTHSDYILPGLVDVHCHGGGGASFPDALDASDAKRAAAEHLRHGTTTMVGSLVTQDEPVLLKQAELLAQLCEEGMLAGIHFEGPFVSAGHCGAQDPRYIREPDTDFVNGLLAACNGWARTMTIAPEKPGVLGEDGIAAALIAGGVIPSYGHTDASSEEFREAVEQTAQMMSGGNARCNVPTATHLFNGMAPMHHREPGPVPEALAAARRGRLIVEVICDGVHVSPSLVRNVYELVGREAITFVTDSMAAAGMEDGHYRDRKSVV